MTRIILSLLLRSLFSGGGNSVSLRGLFGSGWVLPMALGAAAGGFATYKYLEIPNSARHGVTPVREGVLYRSGHLEPKQLEEAIRRRGIRTVVNLCDEHPEEKALCQRLRVAYLNHPLGDVWCLCGKPSPDADTKAEAPADLVKLWRLLDDRRYHPVLIHGQHGVHRTGAVVALIRMRYERWHADDAIAEMDRYGFDSHQAKFDGVKDFLRSFGETMRIARTNQTRR